MKSKEILIFLLLLVVVGLAGFYVGTRTSGDGAESDYVSSGVSDEPVEIRRLKARLAENPRDAEALSRLGDAYFGLRRFGEAAAYYKRAIEVNPDDVDSYNDLGLANHYLGNSPEALKYVEEGIKRDPSYQRIWLTKGFVLAYGVGNIEEARSAWEKALSLDPDSQVGKAAADFLKEIEGK
ncbi:MAG TPA: tetratricopeptide repeat protein [Deltaproteobacteria bacterium]|nr:tetratricopeptide repeat protein [Deltaproteobacteria bacterium]